MCDQVLILFVRTQSLWMVLGGLLDFPVFQSSGSRSLENAKLPVSVLCQDWFLCILTLLTLKIFPRQRCVTKQFFNLHHLQHCSKHKSHLLPKCDSSRSDWIIQLSIQATKSRERLLSSGKVNGTLLDAIRGDIFRYCLLGVRARLVWNDGLRENFAYTVMIQPNASRN